MWKKLFKLTVIGGIVMYVALFSGTGFVLGAPPPAADCDQYCSDSTAWSPPASTFCLCPAGPTSTEVLIESVINFVFMIATAIVPILVLVAGLMFITSGGEIEKVSKAKKTIWYTIIGYAIVLFARAFITLLKDIIGTP